MVCISAARCTQPAVSAAVDGRGSAGQSRAFDEREGAEDMDVDVEGGKFKAF